MSITPHKEEKYIIINSEYILTQAQLKAYLGFKGDITSIGLLEGLSPNDRANGVSPDRQKFFINITEKKKVEEQ